MIVTLLDQTQKLFSRGLLIAAFVPTLAFVAVAAYLWWGIEPLRSLVDAWAAEGFQQFGLELLVTLGVVYLFAYILYGLRAAMYQVYRGEWQIPVLSWIGLKLEERAMAKCQLRLRQMEDAMNEVAWTAEDIQFDEMFIRGPKLKSKRGKKVLRTYRRLYYRMLTQDLRRYNRWNNAKYRKVLQHARLLQASRKNLAPDDRKKVDSFVEYLKRNHSKQPKLRLSSQQLQAQSERDWERAVLRLYESFPSNERWLKPTRFGNVASVLELYPLERYGVPLNTLWPRLLHVISQDTHQRIDEAKIYMDFTVVLSFLILLEVIVGIIATFVGPPTRNREVNLLIVVVLLAGAYTFYLLSIQAFRTYAVQVQAAIDLSRLKLLDALDLERPKTPAAEVSLWSELRQFWAQGDMPETYVKFKQAERATPDKPPEDFMSQFRKFVNRIF